MVFFERFISMFTAIPFIVITIVGNTGAIACGVLLYYIEVGTNPAIKSLYDSIWWAFVTVTSVGYGDITPVTPAGRLVGIVLMIFGTGVFATYTAIFANVMLGVEFSSIGKRVKMLKRNVEGMQTNLHQEDLMLERELAKMNKTLNCINTRLTSLEKIREEEERNGEIE